ncbi:hypothetical protein Vi05172_g12905 [Venturia inaequalis]|nr:hypothetical protein Vi05172_g12905 [Venturia inaequalis]
MPMPRSASAASQRSWVERTIQEALKLRLWKHCHFARNDPNHQCFGTYTIEREIDLPKENCPDCVAAGKARIVA